MADLRNQRRMAAEVLKCGENRVWASGKRKGPGSRKGTANARVRDKERWMATIRPIRDELKTLRDEGKITPSVYRLYYRKAKGGMFKSRRHLKQHMTAAGHLKEEI